MRIKSITSVSQDTIRKRNEIIKHKLGYQTTGLALRRNLLPFVLEHRDDIKQIAKKYGVERVWLIGSTAEGTDTTMSDLDLWVFHIDDKLLTSFMYEVAQFMGVPVDVFVEGKDGHTWNNYVADYGHIEL